MTLAEFTGSSTTRSPVITDHSFSVLSSVITNYSFLTVKFRKSVFGNNLYVWFVEVMFTQNVP